MNLSDFHIHDVGNLIQLAGALYADGETVYLVPLPEALTDDQELMLCVGEEKIQVLDMSLEDWRTFIRQTDLLEVEVVAPDEEGKIVKAILRKSQRQVDQGTSWEVYKRDGYRCRYCGIDGVPMTVDHLVLWEEGGPATPENLVTACRKCNKKRGNMQYGDWLQSPYYKKVSRRLIIAAVEANEAVFKTLPGIPRGMHRSKSKKR